MRRRRTSSPARAASSSAPTAARCTSPSPLEGAVSTLDSVGEPAHARRASSRRPGAASPQARPRTSDASTDRAHRPRARRRRAGPDRPRRARPLASIFSTSLAGTELLNPCIAVNGLDGVCSVGDGHATNSTPWRSAPTASRSTARRRAAARSTCSRPDASGALAQTGCVMVDAPHGLCSSGAAARASRSRWPSAPTARTSYAASERLTTDSRRRAAGRARRATPRAARCRRAGCVEYEEPPQAEGRRRRTEEEEAESARASAADSGCAGAAGPEQRQRGRGQRRRLVGLRDRQRRRRRSSLATRPPAQLTEASCADSDDGRCTSLPRCEGVSGAAVSPDGRQVYVAASTSSDAVMVFGVGAAVTTRARIGDARRHGARSASPARRACTAPAAAASASRARSRASRGRHGHRARACGA